MSKIRTVLESEFISQGVKEAWSAGFLDLDAESNVSGMVGVMFDDEAKSFDPRYVNQELDDYDKGIYFDICLTNEVTRAMLSATISDYRLKMWDKEEGWVDAYKPSS